MSEDSFTPGPWHADGCCIKSQDRSIAHVFISNRNKNKTLISHAPELYDTLGLVLAWYGVGEDKDTAIVNRVREVMAKVRE